MRSRACWYSAARSSRVLLVLLPLPLVDEVPDVAEEVGAEESRCRDIIRTDGLLSSIKLEAAEWPKPEGVPHAELELVPGCVKTGGREGRSASNFVIMSLRGTIGQMLSGTLASTRCIVVAGGCGPLVDSGAEGAARGAITRLTL